ncbi:NAD(P)-binding protein [Thozetella sp. PMI_491]|nr:NAD(P)-binding protein [Thozetella sp. PMI_491]
MKAWVALRAGEPKDVLELKTGYPTPAAPRAGEIIVRVSYVALNPGDLHMIRMKIPWKGQTVPGMDFIGEVIQVGPPSAKLSQIRVGATVTGTTSMANVFRGVGVLAEYVLVAADLVVEKPDGLDEPVAAGLFGVAGQTSMVMLHAGGLKDGDHALINGASGGVGSILLQLLCASGVRVTAICSAKNEALVRKLGAEEVIDYTAYKSLSDHLTSISTLPGNEPFDAIFDCIGNNPLYQHCAGYMKRSGKYLCIEGGPFGRFKLYHLLSLIGVTSRTFQSVFSTPSGLSASEIRSWYEKGAIVEIPIDGIYNMDEVPQALEKLATGRTVGKIFVKVK